MNVFVTILNESLNEVKEEMTLQSNEYEIVDFILKKVKSYLGKICQLSTHALNNFG